MMKNLRKRGFTLIELMIVVAIIGILAAIAIPNFIRFQARSKQGEAKANLKALFTSERSLFQEKDKYFATIRDIGFSPERGNRYAYYAGAITGCENRSTTPSTGTAADACIGVDTFKYGAGVNQTPAAKVGTITFTGGNLTSGATGGIGGTCPACDFYGVAAGNIDNETVGIDTWYISSADSINTPVTGAADNVPAGQPQNSDNDVVNDS